MSKQDEITAPDEAREGQRIAKVMARVGLCSRRDAEQWIAEGRVTVNGEVLTSPAFNVSDADIVVVDGERLRSADRTRLFLFHKPRGLVTTARDPEGRRTIFEALPEDLPRVVAIGRLDINTEGLLLLTNDGGLSRVLELPATGWLRRYRVRAHGTVLQAQLDALKDGVTIEGVNYLGIEAKVERQQGSNVWLTMGLREGKNREIKRVLEHMGLSVNRLIRVSFGPFELGELVEGELVEVRTRVLKDQLGPKLAKQAQANFDAEVEAAPAPQEYTLADEKPQREHRGDEPRKRKHVSVLRAEARDAKAGPRKRIERTTTADRKGREVQIERVSLAKPPKLEPPRRRAPPRRGADGEAPRARRAPGEGFNRDPARREGGAARASSSEGRREYTPRPPRGDRPERAGASEGRREYTPRPPRGDRPERAGASEGRREYAPRPPRGDRPERASASEGRREYTPRPPRGDRPERASASEGRREYTPRPPRGDRPERSGASEGRREFTPRPPRGDRPERAPRRDDAAPRRGPRAGSFDERRHLAPRAPREDRPERAPRAGAGEERREFKPRAPRDGARPPRAGAGGKPFAPRAGGKPPRKPGPGGKSGPGGKPPRGRPAR